MPIECQWSLHIFASCPWYTYTKMSIDVRRQKKWAKTEKNLLIIFGNEIQFKRSVEGDEEVKNGGAQLWWAYLNFSYVVCTRIFLISSEQI